MKNDVKSIELDNGLTLNLEDISRPISADSCVVKALFSIEFVLTGEDAEGFGLPLDELKKALGTETGRFEKLLERNFIRADRKEAVFEEITASYLATNLGYLSHPEFKNGLIRRRLVEKRGRF